MTALHAPLRELPEDDTGLVQAHLHGVDGAFDELFRRYQPRLVAFLTHRVRDEAAAEDLAQETLIRAMHALGRFDPTRPLWPWLRRIAANAAIDMIRARSRADALTAALASHRRDDVEAGPDLGEEEVLARAMAAVPERQRQALQKCYVEGWRPVDVADQFGVGSNAFEQLLHRARRNLRKAYAHHDAPGRAAGMAWLLLIARPMAQVMERVRRIGVQVPHLAEVAVATVTVTTIVAVGPTATPAPRTVLDSPLERVEVVQPLEVDAGTDAASAVEVPADVAPAEAVAPSASLPLPSGAGREAPAAITPAAPAGSAPGAPAVLAPPGTTPDQHPSPSGQQPPTSAPEAIGGCGSVVRDAVCQTIGLVTQ